MVNEKYHKDLLVGISARSINTNNYVDYNFDIWMHLCEIEPFEGPIIGWWLHKLSWLEVAAGFFQPHGIMMNMNTPKRDQSICKSIDILKWDLKMKLPWSGFIAWTIFKWVCSEFSTKFWPWPVLGLAETEEEKGTCKNGWNSNTSTTAHHCRLLSKQNQVETYGCVSELVSITVFFGFENRKKWKHVSISVAPKTDLWKQGVFWKRILIIF